MVQLSHPYMTCWKNHSFDHMDFCWQSTSGSWGVVSVLDQRTNIPHVSETMLYKLNIFLSQHLKDLLKMLNVEIL